MRVALQLLAATTLLACRDRTSQPAPQPAATRKDAGVALAPPDAAARPGAQAPVPGSWPYVTALSRCVMSVRAAPASEIEAARVAALSRLAGLGEEVNIEMSALGDRVGNIDIGEGRPAPTAPKTAADIKALGRDVLSTYADVLGLTPDEVAHLKPTVKRVTDTPAIAWEYNARLERHPTGPMPVRSGSGEIFIDFDRRGAVVVVTIDDELLPPITVCADTLRPEQIEKAVVGRALHWTNDTGRTNEGNVAPGDIVKTTRRVMHVRGSAAEGDLVVGAVYAVQINHDYLPWTILVDPAAGIAIETRELVDDE